MENENFSHPVKAAEVEVHYGERRGQAELHKAGCQHRSKADEVRPF